MRDSVMQIPSVSLPRATNYLTLFEIPKRLPCKGISPSPQRLVLAKDLAQGAFLPRPSSVL